MDERKFEPIEKKEKLPHQYDAVIVLGGGLRKVGDRYYPTDYRDADEFGMYGAGMRIVAALDLYLNSRAGRFVFATGKTEKGKSQYGSDIPTEAEVYKEKFLRMIDGLKRREDYKERFSGLDAPEIVLEDKSFNTMSNIKEILKMIEDNNWRNVAIVSSDYHIPRVKDLYERLSDKSEDSDIKVDFLSAENIVKKAEPGKYDEVMRRAYESEVAQRRLKSETQGVEDLKKGTYASGEFQFEKKEKGSE